MVANEKQKKFQCYLLLLFLFFSSPFIPPPPPTRRRRRPPSHPNLLPLRSWEEAGCYLFTLMPPLPSPSRSRICNDLLMSLKDALCGSLLHALMWWTLKESRKVPRSERGKRLQLTHGTQICFTGCFFFTVTCSDEM